MRDLITALRDVLRAGWKRVTTPPFKLQEPVSVVKIEYKGGNDYLVTLSDGRLYRGGLSYWARYPTGEQMCPLTDPLMDVIKEAVQRYKWEQKDGL